MKVLFFSFRRQIILLFLVFGLFFCKTQAAISSPYINLINNKPAVIEHLRIQVPREYRKAWLIAEKGSWAPWLAKKKGFLGRQLFWDPQNQEATLLISWSSYEDWKSISQLEIDLVQKEFEKIASDELLIEEKENIFPLIYEGELLPQ
tara:strand:- start:5244 stop:5687 length:444 start_codon:yes stop_codon:yes gene_type:complete